MNKHPYTALTIGPIYNTINRARATSELWGASFFFSRQIMGRIIKALPKEVKDKIIIPHTEENESSDETLKKVGLYPDRLFIKGEHYEALENAINHVKDKIKKDLNTEQKNDCRDLDKFIENFFYFHIVQTDVPGEKNAVKQLSQLLDGMEMHPKVLNPDELCLENFLLNIKKTKFHESIFHGKRPYPSIIEISVSKMIDENDIGAQAELDKLIDQFLNEDDDLKKDTSLVEGILKKDRLKKYFKQPHKYIGIVQSDGDNVGKLLDKIYEIDASKVKEFSKALREFSTHAAYEIEKYGGQTVYAGGDDLLFFAPVLTHDENIFSLIKKLDKIFEEKILNNEQLTDVRSKMERKPSMSYGVAITYYKFPLNEAREMAYAMLRKAKKSGKTKNKVAYYWQKHSGQSFHDILKKDDDFYKKFIDLLNEVTGNNQKTGNKKEDDKQKNNNSDNNSGKKLMSSFIHDLMEKQFLYKRIIDDEQKLKNYFANAFDEPVHKTEEGKAMKKIIIDLLEASYATSKEIVNDQEDRSNQENNKSCSEQEDKLDKEELAIRKTYNALRFAKFLTEKPEKENHNSDDNDNN